MKTDRNLYLVGLMGAGKTTIGRSLAKRLSRDFLDTDHEIEARTGVGIPTIFEIEGERGFRDREKAVLSELCSRSGLVLATGGGAVLAEENRRALLSTGTVIYLHAVPEVLYERTRNDRNRPLLQVDDPLSKLRALYGERDPLYREIATLVVEAKHGTVAQMAQHIEGELGRRCVL